MDSQINHIKLREVRDFSNLLNATAAFLKENFRFLFKAYLIMVLPFMIFYIGSIVFTIALVDMLQDPYYGQSPVFSLISLAANFISILGFSVNASMLYAYMDLYDKQQSNNFSMRDLWRHTRRFIGRIIGVNFLVALITSISLFFCVFPGIYLGIALSLAPCAAIFENLGIGSSISRSMGLTKGFWWNILALMIVVSLIVGVLIAFAYSVFGLSFFWAATSENTTLIVIVAIIFGLVIGGGIFFLANIPMITLAFTYFSIIERKEMPCLTKRVEDIASNESTGGKPQHFYAPPPPDTMEDNFRWRKNKTDNKPPDEDNDKD